MERSGDLLLDRRHVGLPAEPPDHGFAGRLVPHDVGSSGDPVTVVVVGVGGGDDVRLRDRLEQAHADDLWRQPWRDHRVVAELAELRVGDAVRRRDECVRRAVGVGAVDRLRR